MCHTAEWYSRFTRVIFALRRVVLLRSGIREMCERYSHILRVPRGGGRDASVPVCAVYPRRIIADKDRRRRPKTEQKYTKRKRRKMRLLRIYIVPYGGVIFASRRVILLRSGIREMCERYSHTFCKRYSRTSCECRAAGGRDASVPVCAVYTRRIIADKDRRMESRRTFDREPYIHTARENSDGRKRNQIKRENARRFQP